MVAPKTLMGFLTQDNVDFLEVITRSDLKKKQDGQEIPMNPKKRPSSKLETHIIPKEIRPFQEFSPETLHGIYNKGLSDTLYEETSGLTDYSDIDDAYLSIHNEDSFEMLLIKHNHSIVLEALRKTPIERIPHRVKMVRGGQATILCNHSSRLLPDWAATSARQGYTNILPGDSKVHWRFSSDWAKEGYDPVTHRVDELNHSPILPIAQVVKYCIASLARYGYIITDRELFVIRVSATESSRKSQREPENVHELRKLLSENAAVECMAIPWKHDDPETHSPPLTINLALWFLHILAANNGRLRSEPYEPLVHERLVPPSEQSILSAEVHGRAYDSAVSTGKRGPRGRVSRNPVPDYSQPTDEDVASTMDGPHWSFHGEHAYIPPVPPPRHHSVSSGEGSMEGEESPTLRVTRGRSRSNQKRRSEVQSTPTSRAARSQSKRRSSRKMDKRKADKTRDQRSVRQKARHSAV